MKFIFVTGSSGIDKRTIVDLALQRAGRKGKFRVVDLDSKGMLSEDVQNAPDIETARQVLSKFYKDMENAVISDLKDQKGNVIVIGYLTLATNYGYMSVMPDEFFRSFRPDNIVILENAKTDEHENINRYYGTMYSSLSGSVLKIIRFTENRMMNAVVELSGLLKS